MIECTLVTPLAKRTEGELGSISVRTTTGERGILKDHAPIVAHLEDDSHVRLRRGENEEVVYKLGRNSFLQFAGNRAVILSSNCSRA